MQPAGVSLLRVPARSVHLIGRVDELFTQQELMEIPQLCDPNLLVIFHHSGGHIVPRLTADVSAAVSHHVACCTSLQVPLGVAHASVAMAEVLPGRPTLACAQPLGAAAAAVADDAAAYDSTELFRRASLTNDNGVLGHLNFLVSCAVVKERGHQPPIEHLSRLLCR